MLKKIMVVITTLCIAMALVACSSSNETKKDKLEALKQSFKDAGFKVGENKESAFSMINATNGFKFTVNDETIEVYEYDKSKLTDEGKKTVEQAKKGSISLGGLSLPAKYNNGIVLVRYDKHKDQEKILEVFNKFK